MLEFVDPNVCSIDGVNPLMLISSNGFCREEFLKVLLPKYKDFLKTDLDGENILHYLTKNFHYLDENFIPSLELILSFCNDPAFVNQKNYSGNTPLNCLVRRVPDSFAISKLIISNQYQSLLFLKEKNPIS